MQKPFGKVCHKEKLEVLTIFGKDFRLIQNLCDRTGIEFSKLRQRERCLRQ